MKRKLKSLEIMGNCTEDVISLWLSSVKSSRLRREFCDVRGCFNQLICLSFHRQVLSPRSASRSRELATLRKSDSNLIFTTMETQAQSERAEEALTEREVSAARFVVKYLIFMCVEHT